MKEKSLLFAFVLCFAFSLNAQTRLRDPKIYIGSSHGITASMVHSSPSIKQGSLLLGYNGGIGFRYIADKNVGIQLELNFSQRGWEEKDNIYSRRLNYVELPFMTHIYMGKNKARFIVNLGPKIAYFISDNVLENNVGNSTDYQYLNPIENKFEYGFVFGLGSEFQFSKQLFVLEARAAYTLSDIFSNSKADYFGFSRNLSISANLGWFFQVK